MVAPMQVHTAQDDQESNKKQDNFPLTESEQNHTWPLKCMLIGSGVVLLAVILLYACLGLTLATDAVQVGEEPALFSSTSPTSPFAALIWHR